MRTITNLDTINGYLGEYKWKWLRPLKHCVAYLKKLLIYLPIDKNMKTTMPKLEKSKSDKENWLLKFIISTIISIIITYFSVTWAFNEQMESGKYLAFEITSLYAYNLANNGMDLNLGKYKSSKQDKEMYLRMLKLIENQLSSFCSNPYFVSLIKNYPEIEKLKILTSNEIYKLENSDSLVTTGVCHLEYFKLYEKVKKDLPSRFFKKDGRFYELDKDMNSLNIEIKNKMNENIPFKPM